MNLTINWSNYNGGTEDGVNIYRDVNPIPDTPLPSPLATLAAGSTSYVDTTVVRGTKYYYRIGIFKGGDQQLTKNRAIRAVASTDTGPGPQTIANGDWDLGYFGITRSTDLISYGNLASNLGLGSTGSIMTDRDWIKLAYKGKVLLIARNTARYNLTYNALYAAGAVFGTNDNGLIVPSGAVATNQYKPQIIASFTYIPRLLQGLPSSVSAYPATATNNTSLTADPGSNEWDDIMGAIIGGTARWTGDTATAKLTQLRDDFGAYLGATCAADYCQGLPNIANTTTLWRGGRLASATWNPGPCASIPVASVSTTSSTLNGSTGQSVFPVWRPVLELVL